MKKVLIILASVAAFVLLCLLIAPLFFKDAIFSLIKKSTNENINATVNFSGADISLLHDFPRLSVEISDISAANLPPSRDTLFKAAKIEISLNIWTLITEARADILALRLDKPAFFMHISKDSLKNWNISKTDDKASKTDAMRVHLRDVAVENGQFVFLDEAGDKRFEMNGVSIKGEADYSGAICAASANAQAQISFSKGGLTMLDATRVAGKANVEIDVAKQHYVLKNNEFRLNELPLSLAGTIDMAEKYIDFNLYLKAAPEGFGAFLSAIPKMPAKSEALQAASGRASAEAWIKGRMNDDDLPGFTVLVKIENGSFQGRQSPVAIANIQMDMSVSNTDGKPDNTVIDLKKLTLAAGGDPFMMRAVMRNPISDPYIDAAMKGVIKLKSWKNNLSLPDGTNIDGIISADAALRGRMSAIKAKKFENFTAAGTIAADNVKATSTALPASLFIKTLSLKLSPQYAELSNLDGTLGDSDFKGEGRLDNIIGFLIAKENLVGSLSVQSRKFNCNPWLGLTQPSEKHEQKESKPIELPDRADITLSAAAGEVLYDNMTVRNVLAKLRAHDKTVFLENASMDAIGGKITMKGIFDARNPSKPHSKFDLSLKGIDIAEAYKTFGVARAFAPFLEFMRGNFDAGINFDSDLDINLKPDLPTLSSLGGLHIERIAVDGFKPFAQAAGLLKLDALNNPSLTQIASNFVIEKGRFKIPKTSLKFGGYEGAVEGSNGLDKSIDYTLTLNVPAGNLPQKANQALSGLLRRDVAVFGQATIPVKILFKGAIDNPQVSASIDNSAASQIESAAKALQDEAKRAINEEKSKLEQRAAEEARKLRQKAKEEEEKLKQKAAEEQEKIKKKVEDEAKKKAEELLKKSPFNPFKPK